MLFEPDLLDKLEELTPVGIDALVFRHMFGKLSPERENTRGARWNPKNTPAIYVSRESETCLAEVEFQISQQPLRPSTRRTLYTIKVNLESVLDLTDWNILEKLGVRKNSFGSCMQSEQEIGGATAWLGFSGLLVPSARVESGTNLVIFPSNFGKADTFTVEDQTEHSTA